MSARVLTSDEAISMIRIELLPVSATYKRPADGYTVIPVGLLNCARVPIPSAYPFVPPATVVTSFVFIFMARIALLPLSVI